jgi:hypothetical protein
MDWPPANVLLCWTGVVIVLYCLLSVGGLPWVYALLETAHLNHFQGWLSMVDPGTTSSPVTPR